MKAAVDSSRVRLVSEFPSILKPHTLRSTRHVSCFKRVASSLSEGHSEEIIDV